MSTGREIHVVHDDDGTILALVEAAATEGPGGIRLTSTPVPGPGQQAVRVTVADQHANVSLLELLERFELDHAQSPPTLRERAAGG